jgi:RNA polymerase sigma-70 factor (ECF subfamily)
MTIKKEDFLNILANYQGILHKVGLVYFKNKSDRDENFQEIIYQLWKSFSSIKNHESIGSWIYAVSINTSISRIKQNSRLILSSQTPEIPDKNNIIEDITMNESLQLLLSAIHELNAIDKSIMLLYLEEKSYQEISEIIGISKSNVGVRINRAKKSLKKNLINY